MSTQKGNIKKKGQKHQNQYSFKHNKNSMLTRKIIEAPLDHLCEKCLKKLEWKIKYRKYTPLSVPSYCKLCEQKSIYKGHRTVCDKCSIDYLVCTKCMEPVEFFAQPMKRSKHLIAKVDSTFEEIIDVLKERQRRTVMRKIENKEPIIFHGEKGFINSITGEVIISIEDINANAGDDSIREDDFEDSDDEDETVSNKLGIKKKEIKDIKNIIKADNTNKTEEDKQVQIKKDNDEYMKKCAEYDNKEKNKEVIIK